MNIVRRSALGVLALAACTLTGCENPEGQTERFLTEEMKHLGNDWRGKVPPLPMLKPREVTPLVIKRDPFARR
jgi:hypothetical protein